MLTVPGNIRDEHYDTYLAGVANRLHILLPDTSPWGFHYYDKSGYIAELTDPVIDVIAQHGADRHSPLSLVLFYRLDAAYSDVPDDATAFGGRRTDRYTTFIVADCPDPTMLPAERAWVRNLYDALRPHMLEAGTYVNAIGADETDQVRAAYGTKYDRLRTIKTPPTTPITASATTPTSTDNSTPGR